MPLLGRQIMASGRPIASKMRNISRKLHGINLYDIQGDAVWWMFRIVTLAAVKRDFHLIFLEFLAFFSFSCHGHYLGKEVHRRDPNDVESLLM